MTDDTSQPTGKRKIRRCSEESLWEVLAEWYLDNNRDATLEDIFPKWLAWKQTPTNEDNIKRLKASWKSFDRKSKEEQALAIDKALAI